MFDKNLRTVYTSTKANRAAPTANLDCPAAVTLARNRLAPASLAAPYGVAPDSLHVYCTTNLRREERL